MENLIIIPVYNDWKSLNFLLTQIEKKITEKVKVFVINDASTEKVSIKNKNFKKIKKIIVFTLKKNLGSQKAISVGLHYLKLHYLKKRKKNFLLAIMDGDGEDNPYELNKMFKLAKKNKEFIITSHRKKRNERFVIQIGYKIHLIISLLLTWNWISFGNFTAFHSNNLNKINLKHVWIAYSSAILKSCKIKKTYSSRKKRYFGNSKVNFINLIEHSLRILSIFYSRIIFSTFILIIIFHMVLKEINIITYLLVFFNLLIYSVKLKNQSRKSINYKNYLDSFKYF